MKNNREKDIQELCDQILNLDFDEHYNTGREFCPLCNKDAQTLVFTDNLNHHLDCGVLIAKDLSTNSDVT